MLRESWICEGGSTTLKLPQERVVAGREYFRETQNDAQSLTLRITELENGTSRRRMASEQSRQNFTQDHVTCVTRSIDFFIEQRTTPSQWALLKELL